MDENALRQENSKTGKDPLGQPVRKQQSGQLSDVKGGTKPEGGIYQSGRNQQNVETICEKSEKPQKIPLQDVGQHGLEGIGAAVARNQDRGIVPSGKPSILCDVPDDPETVDFVRPFAKRLYEDERQHTKKSKGEKQQVIKKFIFEKASYFGHFSSMPKRFTLRHARRTSSSASALE